ERVEGCHSPPNTCWNSAKLATVTARCTGPLRVRPMKAVTALGRRAMTGSVGPRASSRPGAPRSTTDVNPRRVLVVVADSTTAAPGLPKSSNAGHAGEWFVRLTYVPVGAAAGAAEAPCAGSTAGRAAA